MHGSDGHRVNYTDMLNQITYELVLQTKVITSECQCPPHSLASFFWK